jgi:hypothetical protein
MDLGRLVPYRRPGTYGGSSLSTSAARSVVSTFAYRSRGQRGQIAGTAVPIDDTLWQSSDAADRLPNE